MKFLNTSTLRHFDTSTLRHFDTSTLRHFDTSTLRHFDTSTLRHFDTSTLRHFDTSTLRHFKLNKFLLNYLHSIAFPLLVFLSFTMNGYSQLSVVYELKLTKECPGSGEEFGGTPFAYVGLKVLNYDPQLGLPPKPHHTVKPTLYADINGEVTLTLSCRSSAYAIYYYISGEWRDYFTILETDCTDPTGTYIKGVKLPGNFNIREWVSCDYGSNGTRYIAAGPFGRSVDCDQMNIHIPNQFFTGAYGTQENEFILKVNRVNRLTGQVSHLTSFSFTA